MFPVFFMMSELLPETRIPLAVAYLPGCPHGDLPQRVKHGNTGADACIYYVFGAHVIIFRTNKCAVEQRRWTASRRHVTTKVRKRLHRATA